MSRGRRRCRPAVVLPWYLQFAGQDKRIAGQTGGRMGELNNPFLVEGDPSDHKFQVQGIRLADDVPVDRVVARRALLGELDAAVSHPWRAEPTVTTFSRHVEAAFSMLGDIKANEAFRLDKESPALRER